MVGANAPCVNNFPKPSAGKTPPPFLSAAPGELAARSTGNKAHQLFSSFPRSSSTATTFLSTSKTRPERPFGAGNLSRSLPKAPHPYGCFASGRSCRAFSVSWKRIPFPRPCWMLDSNCTAAHCRGFCWTVSWRCTSIHRHSFTLVYENGFSPSLHPGGRDARPGGFVYELPRVNTPPGR